MTHLIAIETSGDTWSVSGYIRGQKIGYLCTDEPRSHSSSLVSMIQELLQTRMDNIVHCVAVSAGPGSFTGLRIGVSAAKGLAFGRNARIIAVPTLESVASGAMRNHPELQSCFVVAPSRKGEVYYGHYSRGPAGYPESSDQEQACSLSEFKAVISEEPGATVYQVTADLVDTAIEVMKPDAAEVGYCALDRLARKEFADTSTFEPYYLKAFYAKKPTQSALDRLPF